MGESTKMCSKAGRKLLRARREGDSAKMPSRGAGYIKRRFNVDVHVNAIFFWISFVRDISFSVYALFLPFLFKFAVVFFSVYLSPDTSPPVYPSTSMITGPSDTICIHIYPISTFNTSTGLSVSLLSQTCCISSSCSCFHLLPPLCLTKIHGSTS